MAKGLWLGSIKYLLVISKGGSVKRQQNLLIIEVIFPNQNQKRLQRIKLEE